MRSLTKISDLSVSDLETIVAMADEFRETRGQSSAHTPLTGRFVALVFV